MRIFAALLALTLAGPAARAQEVVAVVSSTPGPYQAALDAFLKALGRRAAVTRLPARPALGRARVIVAFGGEAALQTYPESATLITCLAPSIAARLRHEGPYVFMTMKPHPATLLADLKTIQPSLNRLALVSSSTDSDLYLADLRRAAQTVGVSVFAARADGPDAIPDALRSLEGKADALWLAPDPALVTPASFQAIKQFSWDHKTPFYAPTAGLVAAGAAGAVAVSPAAAGRQAASLARRALAGETLPDFVYPAEIETTINVPSAEKAGLTPAPAALERAARVIK